MQRETHRHIAWYRSSQAHTHMRIRTEYVCMCVCVCVCVCASCTYDCTNTQRHMYTLWQYLNTYARWTLHIHTQTDIRTYKFIVSTDFYYSIACTQFIVFCFFFWLFKLFTYESLCVCMHMLHEHISSHTRLKALLCFSPAFSLAHFFVLFFCCKQKQEKSECSSARGELRVFLLSFMHIQHTHTQTYTHAKRISLCCGPCVFCDLSVENCVYTCLNAAKVAET